MFAPLSGGDDNATKEVHQLSRGLDLRDLKKEAEEADHHRSEHFKDHFERVAIFALWTLYSGFAALGFVWLLNAILPAPPLHWWWGMASWLSDDQMNKVQGVLTGGAIAGLVADHFKRRLG